MDVYLTHLNIIYDIFTKNLGKKQQDSVFNKVYYSKSNTVFPFSRKNKINDRVFSGFYVIMLQIDINGLT